MQTTHSEEFEITEDAQKTLPAKNSTHETSRDFKNNFIENNNLNLINILSSNILTQEQDKDLGLNLSPKMPKSRNRTIKAYNT